MSAKINDIFDEKNVSRSSWFKFQNIGDFIFGTLTAKKVVKSSFSKTGESNAYEILASDGLSGGQKIKEGVVVSVGGKSSIDAGLSTAKLGQIVGIKFVKTAQSKTKGYQEAKIIQVFTKGEMDNEWLKSQDDSSGF